MPISRETFEAFIQTLRYPPNPFQRAILESIAFETSGHIVVSALAGSGKTSLLMMLANLFNHMGSPSATFLAFNKKIRDEMNQRLPANYRAINSHSLGNTILLNRMPKTKMDYRKWAIICRELLEDHYPHRDVYNKSRTLEALCSKVMLNAVDLADLQAVLGIAVRYRLFNNEAPDLFLLNQVPKALQHAQEIWERTGAISFDEMLYLPVKLKLPPPTFTYVLVDECQDLNVLQQDIAFASLAKGGCYIFVGDKNQAVYGFAGADAASFDRIIDTTGGQVYPLNTCYRCPTSHIEVAQRIVPQLEAAPNAEPGVIEYVKSDQLPTLVKPGVLVMCRLNAPLISTYFDLIARQIPAKVMGKDIGRDLVNTLEKVANFDGFRYERLIEYLEVYRKQQLHNLEQKGANESQVELLNDKVDCLIVCVENFDGVKTLTGLKDILLDLFKDDNDDNWNKLVALCTVHKAKGLEADETFILRPEKMPLRWPGQARWELEQELNIKYVALTRAKKKLTVVIDSDDAIGCLDAPPPVFAPEVVGGEPLDDDAPTLPTETPAVVEPETPAPAAPPTPAPEPAPVAIKPVPDKPKRSLEEIVNSLSLTELDTLIELFTAARQQRLEKEVAK